MQQEKAHQYHYSFADDGLHSYGPYGFECLPCHRKEAWSDLVEFPSETNLCHSRMVGPLRRGQVARMPLHLRHLRSEEKRRLVVRKTYPAQEEAYRLANASSGALVRDLACVRLVAGSAGSWAACRASQPLQHGTIDCQRARTQLAVVWAWGRTLES